jgi:hypothetical protein
MIVLTPQQGEVQHAGNPEITLKPKNLAKNGLLATRVMITLQRQAGAA